MKSSHIILRSTIFGTFLCHHVVKLGNAPTSTNGNAIIAVSSKIVPSSMEIVVTSILSEIPIQRLISVFLSFSLQNISFYEALIGNMYQDRSCFQVDVFLVTWCSCQDIPSSSENNTKIFSFKPSSNESNVRKQPTLCDATPGEMSEQQVQKFHTDDVSLPRSHFLKSFFAFFFLFLSKINPWSPSIHMQSLHSDLHVFAWRIKAFRTWWLFY